jgi:sucrose phosphorylase
MEFPLQPGFRKRDWAIFIGCLAQRLQRIYKTAFSEGLVNRIAGMALMQQDSKPLWNESDVILITYGNSIYNPAEKPLRTLRRFLQDKLTGIVTIVHILPFFPYTSDDGFSVSDFTEVNPELGSWEDIAAISAEFGLMIDLVINHVSAKHPWFENYLSDRNPGKDFFIEAEPGIDYSCVIRPRSTPLFTRFKGITGVKEVWTTFSSDQVDLNFSNPDVLVEMIRILLTYLRKGARIIRLDAIAFLWKAKGTACLHLPETHEIVKLLREIVSFVSPGTVILTETNVPNLENWSYFGNHDEAHMVYQFSLPPLLLHALFTGNSEYISRWASEIPATGADQTYLNYTASHDGIGVRPLEGILPEVEIRELLEGMTSFGGKISQKRNNDGTLSPYEINITYLDAMKGDRNGPDSFQEARFLCAQTIMMSLQGIPAFYFNSLVGTANDYEGLAHTGIFRRINRKRWYEDELIRELSSDTLNSRLFEELTRLIRIRKQCTAFHPACPQYILFMDSRLFAFERAQPDGRERILCLSNISNHPVEIDGSAMNIKKGHDLISRESLRGIPGPILLKAYQTRWIAL